MKHFVIILFCLPFLAYAQNYNYKDGYRFIKKAKNSLNKNKINEAEQYIKKASKSNYGFCGNAWASAEGDIDIIRSQILNKKGKYDEALKVLDSIGGCSLGANCDKRDSLKIETLFLKYGKIEVVNAFKLLTKVKKHKTDYNESYSVYLKKLDYTMSFGDGPTVIYVDKNRKPIKQEHTNNMFIKIARQYRFYKLIEQEINKLNAYQKP